MRSSRNKCTAGTPFGWAGGGLYYKVSPCPVCGSRCTGRMIRKPLTGADYMVRASLEHGEIVRPVQKEPINNAFCMDCNAVWPESVYPEWMSADEIEDEKRARGTYELLRVFDTERKGKKR